MPSPLAYEIERALQSMQAAMTDTASDGDGGGSSVSPVFTWKGNSYPCTPSKSVKGKLFGAGGFTLDNSLILTVLVSNLPTPGPQPDQFLTYNSDRFRIDTVSTSADGSSVTLTCNDPNRAAGIIEREM